MSLRFVYRSRRERFRRGVRQCERRAAWSLGIRRERDWLTGLPNRFWLEQVLPPSLRDRAGALVLVDLDEFAVWNHGDRGTVGADQMLVDVASDLRTLCDSDESCFRIGGDVFVLLLPGADLAGATSVAERARLTIKNSFAHLEPPAEVTRPTWVTPTATCSVIAWTTDNRPLLEQVVVVARDLNAAGKAAGRNVVAAAEIDWQARQVERLSLGGEEREVFTGAPLNTLIERADPLYHHGAAAATGAVG